MSDDRYPETSTGSRPARVQAFLMTNLFERLGGSRWPLIVLSVVILLMVVIGGFVGTNSSLHG